ncbi:MAG: XisI protein [Bacteroidota bacterium]
MDKVVEYKKVVRDIVKEVMPTDALTPIQTVLIEDDNRGHYLLYNDGWRGERRIYGCFLHIEVREDGKVWLQHNGTDLIVGQMLLDAGIPKQDIVLGFHAPIMRPDTGFALA